MIFRVLVAILFIYCLSFQMFGPKPNQKILASRNSLNTSCRKINDNLTKITFTISSQYFNTPEYKAIENMYGNKIYKIDFIIFIFEKKLNIIATVNQSFPENYYYCNYYLNDTCVERYSSIVKPRILPSIEIPEDLNILESQKSKITRWSDEVYEIEINQKLKYRRRYVYIDPNIFPGIWREYGFNEHTDLVVKYLTDFSQRLVEQCQRNINQYTH